MEIRVGQGYDSHRFAPGRPLVLGGVEVPHDQGLDGHSDADALTHAICDALLGAAGLGDIGQHFPDNDPAYEGIDSLHLLERVADALTAQGWRALNIDATIICESPRLAPQLPAMRAALARALEPGAGPERVSVKATTNEKMGFVGRGEGIAAMAVALIARD